MFLLSIYYIKLKVIIFISEINYFLLFKNDSLFYVYEYKIYQLLDIYLRWRVNKIYYIVFIQ